MSDLADTQSGQISLAKSYGDEETRLQGKLDGTLTGLEEEEVKATAEVDALQQAFVEAFSGIEEATTKDVPRFVVPFVVTFVSAWKDIFLLTLTLLLHTLLLKMNEFIISNYKPADLAERLRIRLNTFGFA